MVSKFDSDPQDFQKHQWLQSWQGSNLKKKFYYNGVKLTKNLLRNPNKINFNKEDKEDEDYNKGKNEEEEDEEDEKDEEDEEEEEDEEYDEYDEQYENLLEKYEDTNSEEFDIDYFKNLSCETKESYLEQIEEIYDINDNHLM